MTCSVCQRVRGWLPQSIRERLERLRAQQIRQNTKVDYTLTGGAFVSTPLALTDEERAAIVLSYTTAARQAPTGAPSPRHLPEIPPGGDGGATIAESQAEHKGPRP